MIQKFVERFMESKPEIEKQFTEKHPENYEDIVRIVVEALYDQDDEYNKTPDPKRIHRIDDGDYQGTLIFIIGANGYQPDIYWSVKVNYGSCSGCDTLEGIRGYDTSAPSQKQVKDYMTLALHIVQGLTEI